MAEAALGRVTPERLSGGAGRPLLVADFQPFSSAPRLSTRLAEHAAGRPVYRLDPLRELARPGGPRPLAEFAADYAAALGADGRAVTVIGYCAAAALAVRVGALLAAARPVSTLLVCPQWPVAAVVGAQFAAFRADLGAPPGPPPAAAAAEPAALLAAMDRILAADLAAVAASRGLAEVPGALDELLAGYRGWLGFLLACAGDAAVPAPPAATDLNISVLTDPTEDAALPAPWPPARRVLRHPAAARPHTVSPELVALVSQACEDR